MRLRDDEAEGRMKVEDGGLGRAGGGLVGRGACMYKWRDYARGKEGRRKNMYIDLWAVVNLARL